MKREELAVLWFDYNDISLQKAERFLKKFDKIECIFDKNLVKNAFFGEIDLSEIKDKLLCLRVEDFEKKVLEDIQKYNITPITYLSSKYPAKLKNIPDPPLVIYAVGDVSLLSKKSIAIVGTRKPTTYGKIVCEKFAKELSSAGLVTVSGLAYGIDTVVAESTLAVGGKTIAVLAGGLDKIYPSQNKLLAEKILSSGGLLLSEQRIGVSSLSYMFLNRNRIVSALCLGTLIIEAGKSSGTMTTARHTVEQGRELFVVPGNINSPQSEGTNALIDEMPDTFTISPDRILYKFKIKKNSLPKSEKQLDLTESDIINALFSSEKTFDELCEITGLSASVLSSKLIKMEMFGLVKKGEGNTYYKV